MILIFTDESGDLGWSLDKPYRFGGSSRFLTIASILVEDSLKHYPERLMRNLYKKFKWNPKLEKKWSDLNLTERKSFAWEAKKLQNRFPSMKYTAIVVKKENVREHIREDKNKLYNYMIKISLIDEMAKHDQVYFYPDPRTVKVASGNSLHDYLSMELTFTHHVDTRLKTRPLDSSRSLNVQFADMLSGVIQGHFEDSKNEPWKILQSTISIKTLYF